MPLVYNVNAPSALIKTTFPRLGHADNHKAAIRYIHPLFRGSPSHMLMSGWWLPEPTVLEHLLECVELLPGLPLAELLTLCVGWLPGRTVKKHLS